MASSFPGGLDNLTNPTATDTLDSATVPHADQHANANDAIEAIESTLGVNPQGGSATVTARLTALDSTVASKETPAGAQAKADAAQSAAISAAATDATTKANAAQSAAISAAATDATTKANAAQASATAVANTKVASVTNGDSTITIGGTATAPTVAVAQANLSLDTSQITWSAITAWAPSTAYAKGALVHYEGVAYRRSVAGTSGATFNSANWQQISPPADSGVTGTPNQLVTTDANGAIAPASIKALTYNFAVTGPGGATLVKGGTSSSNESLVLPSTSGTLIGTGDSKTVTTSMIADNAITHAQIANNTIVDADISSSAAITASKISGTSLVLNPSGQQSVTAGVQIKTASDSVQGLQVARNSVTQSVDIFQVHNSTYTSRLFGVGPRGQTTISPDVGTVVPLQIRYFGSGSSNLTEWTNSAGTSVIAFVSSSGSGVFGGNNGYSSSLAAYTGGNASQIGVTVQGSTSQTADLFRVRDVNSTNLSGINAVGQTFTGSTSTITSGVGGTIQSIATGANPLVTMASNHNLSNGDLVTLASTTNGTYNGTFVISNASGTTFNITTALTTGQAAAGGTVSVPAQVSITARSAGTKGLVVRANASASSTTANLTEWQDSGGTVRTSIRGDGILLSADVRTNTTYVRLSEENSGGTMQLKKLSSSAALPGTTDFAKIYLVAGTTTGTLKLVIRAGTAGAETTILDNIPQ